MNPWPHQERALEAIVPALVVPPRDPARGVLLIAATGAGKTVIIGHACKRYAEHLNRPLRALVVQHRRELRAQNLRKFRRVNPAWACVAYGAKQGFAPLNDAPGAATFANAQALSRPAGLAKMEPVDILVLDEAHHATSKSWGAIIAQAIALNPDVRILGLTATPERADRKSLGEVFGVVADIITVSELVESGYLVRPVAEVAALGVAGELHGVAKAVGGDYDMEQVARIIDRPAISEAIIAQWQAVAGDRQTAFYCATVAHAEHFTAALRDAGVRAACITDKTPTRERDATIEAYARAELQAVVNVGTLTEGWDDQRTSCVAFLRPTTSRSLCIQIIGRGLRIIDPEEHPGVIKTDCLILDFGASIERLDGLDGVLDLGRVRRAREPGPPPMKPCRAVKCGRPIPLWARECPLCGYRFPPRASEAPRDFDPARLELRSIDLVLRTSAFAWHLLSSRARIAVSDRVWSIVFQDTAGAWHAFGAAPREVEADDGRVYTDKGPRHLGAGSIDVCMARSDAFMLAHGNVSKWGRRAGVHQLPPTEKQVAYALSRGLSVGERDTLYTLSCRISAVKAREPIRAALPSLQTVAVFPSTGVAT